MLLLEGAHDAIFFSRIGLADDVLVIVLGGCDKVDEVLQTCRDRKTPAVLAVLDADWGAYVGGPPSLPDVVYPDGADLGIMLISSPAFEGLIRVWGSDEKTTGVDVRAAVLERAVELSLLLRLSQLLDLGLSFKKVDYASYVSRSSLDPDLRKLVLKVIANTADCELTQEGLLKGIDELRPSMLPAELCASGHVAVHVVRRALQRRFGTNEPKALEVDVLERSLIEFYDPRGFASTEIHAAIRAWEKREGCALLT